MLAAFLFRRGAPDKIKLLLNICDFSHARLVQCKRDFTKSVHFNRARNDKYVFVNWAGALLLAWRQPVKSGRRVSQRAVDARSGLRQ